jgi:acyl-CoA thioester hydrolase
MAEATPEFTIVVANLNVQFLGEGFYGDPIVCHTGLLAIGSTSQTIAQLATQADRPIAYAETIMVTMLGGKSAPHPPSYREQMEPWLIRR